MITKAERNRWREELKLTNPFWADTREWLALDTIDDMEAEIAEQAKEIERLKAQREAVKVNYEGYYDRCGACMEAVPGMNFCPKCGVELEY